MCLLSASPYTVDLKHQSSMCIMGSLSKPLLNHKIHLFLCISQYTTEGLVSTTLWLCVFCHELYVETPSHLVKFRTVFLLNVMFYGLWFQVLLVSIGIVVYGSDFSLYIIRNIDSVPNFMGFIQIIDQIISLIDCLNYSELDRPFGKQVQVECFSWQVKGTAIVGTQREKPDWGINRGMVT